MEYRRLGTSNVKVSAVALGTWAIGGWMWGGNDDVSALEAIKQSVDLGVTSIDSAPAYGQGHAEELLGRAVAKIRPRVQILTKYGLRWDSTEGEYFFQAPAVDGRMIRIHRNARRKSVIEECEKSLKRLGTDYIDLYQCHWRDPTTPLEETMAAVQRLLKDGKILAAGVSNFSPRDIETAMGYAPIASDQPPYSMINRQIEDDLVPWCIEHQVGVVVYSPLQRGLLTGKISMNTVFAPTDHRRDLPEFQPGNRRRVLAFLDRLRPVAEAHSATLAQVVINWTIHRPGITAALVGARNARQAQENARAGEFSLSEDEVRQIDSLLEEIGIRVGAHA